MGRGSWRCRHGIHHGLLLPAAAERHSSTGFVMVQIPHCSGASPPLRRGTMGTQPQKARVAPAGSEPSAGRGPEPPAPHRLSQGHTPHTASGSLPDRPPHASWRAGRAGQNSRACAGKPPICKWPRGLRAESLGAAVGSQLKQQHGRGAEAAERTVPQETFPSQSGERFFPHPVPAAPQDVTRAQGQTLRDPAAAAAGGAAATAPLSPSGPPPTRQCLPQPGSTDTQHGQGPPSNTKTRRLLANEVVIQGTKATLRNHRITE